MLFLYQLCGKVHADPGVCVTCSSRLRPDIRLKSRQVAPALSSLRLFHVSVAALTDGADVQHARRKLEDLK